MDFKVIKCEGMYCIHLFQENVQRRAPVNTNLRTPLRGGKFLGQFSDCVPFSYALIPGSDCRDVKIERVVRKITCCLRRFDFVLFLSMAENVAGF